MSRPLRISFAGAWYHVMNRGSAKQNIFLQDAHYRNFLTLLHEIHNRYQVEIHAYCLMPNHYHLLLRTRLPNISRAMRHLDGVYTQRFNKMQDTDGPLFRGRFKAILIDSDEYLLQLNRYIHLNPVKAKLTNTPGQYKWSSYNDYLRPQWKPDWLYTDVTLRQYGVVDQLKKFKRFIGFGIDRKILDFFAKPHMPPVLGSVEFIKTISAQHVSLDSSNTEISDHKLLHSKATTAMVMQAVVEYFNIPMIELTMSQTKRGNYPRRVAIYLARELSDESIQAIANQLQNISYSGVSKVHHRVKIELSNNQVLARDINLIRGQVLTKDK